MKILKKTMSMILIFILLAGNFAFADEVMLISAPIEKDYEGHWAQATIEKWLNEGRVSGYPDGSYKPDNKVTRAEFVKMVNGIIDYNKMSDITYKDIPSSEWYYDYVRVAQSIGYISGYSINEFGPNDPITREQAASILARIQYLKNNAAGAGKFSDKTSLSAWALEAVGAASEAGFISGYEDGSFKPQNNLTRAEAITMLDNVLVNSKNVVVYNDGTELKDLVIEGDLIIAKTVGEGNVYLTNLDIKGDIQVYGGGLNSIYFKNVKIAKIEVTKDKVRLVFEDGSIVENIEVGTETIIENKDGEIQKITVNDKKGVILSGKLGEVTISGVENITLKDAEITKLIVEEKVTILGTGTVKTLEAKADGILYEADVKVDKVELGEGVKEKPEVIKDVPGGGGTGGGPGDGDTPAKVNIKIEIKSPDEAYPKVFNTNKFTKDKLIYDAMIDILKDKKYTDLIDRILEKSISRMDQIQVDDLTDVADIWDKFENYLTGTTSIDLTVLEAAVKAKDIEISDIVAALEEFKDASKKELNQIITNINADVEFDNIEINYYGKELTYIITSTNGTLPTSYSDIAEFLINEILIPNRTIGEFLEEYGTVTITAELDGSAKTASISIGP